MYFPTLASLLLLATTTLAKPLQIQITISSDDIPNPSSHSLTTTRYAKALSPEVPFKLLLVNPESLEPIKDHDTQLILGITPVLIYPPWVSLIPEQFARGEGNLRIEDGKLLDNKLNFVVGKDGLLMTDKSGPGLEDVRWDVVEGKDGIQDLVPVNEGVAMNADSFRVERAALGTRIFVCIPGKTGEESCSDDLKIVTFNAILAGES